MDAQFAHVTEDEIDKIRENSISTKTKQATKYDVKIFLDKIYLFSVIFIQQNRFFPLAMW